MASKEFEGRTALVTGGSRGIGRAICVGLAREGARVAVNYAVNDAAAQETQRLIQAEGVDSVLAKADVSDPAQVQAMVEQVAHDLGPIDLLVTSAGIGAIEPHTEVTFESWRHMMAVNVDGTYLPVMAVKDGMIARGYGRIVCIASIAGLLPRGQMITYATTKAAVIAFARSCADAFGPNVRVNSVAPGVVETELLAVWPEEMLQKAVDETFLKRIGKPSEITETVLFLLSDRSSWTTSQTLVINGGAREFALKRSGFRGPTPTPTPAAA